MSDISQMFRQIGCPLTDDQRQRLAEFKRIMHCERKASSAIKEIQSILALRQGESSLKQQQMILQKALGSQKRKTWGDVNKVKPQNAS
jgi:3-methyladenine DNA glycosylase Tag